MAVFIQIIKIALPVRSYSKNIHSVFFDIINLLSEIFFYDNFIRKPCRFHILNTFHQRITYVKLTPGLIEIIRGHSYDKIIPQLFSSFQKIIMSLMKQIICTISYNFFHYDFASLIAFLSKSINILLSSIVVSPICATRKTYSSLSPPVGLT